MPPPPLKPKNPKKGLNLGTLLPSLKHWNSKLQTQKKLINLELLNLKTNKEKYWGTFNSLSQKLKLNTPRPLNPKKIISLKPWANTL
jgi:hypothetical protein